MHVYPRRSASKENVPFVWLAFAPTPVYRPVRALVLRPEAGESGDAVIASPPTPEEDLAVVIGWKVVRNGLKCGPLRSRG
jgi:hypothetical protein